jgi:hypothetical protein
MQTKEQLPNPFQTAIITSPHDDLCTIESLHKEVFDELLNIFSKLEAEKNPQSNANSPKALVLLSRQAGNGKSHLMGRLCKTLQSRALFLYIQYQDNPDGCWLHVLELIRQELDFPNVDYEVKFKTQGMTPLDDLARDLLTSLIIESIQTGKRKANESFLIKLKNNPHEALTILNKQLPALLTATFLEDLVVLWSQRLITAKVRLNRPPSAWLKVLAAYTRHNPGNEIRSTAVAWLKGVELDSVEIKSLGLKVSEAGFGTSSESNERFRNEQAFNIIRDICSISAFHKPIIFAFDQPETFMNDPKAGYGFGRTIADMWINLHGKMILIAANESHWEKVQAHFALSDLDRFDRSRYEKLRVRGIKKSQATELVNAKLSASGYSASLAQDFLNTLWLDKLFQDNTSEISARKLQEHASIQLELWKGHTPSVKNIPERLEESYETHRTQLLQSAKATAFDATKLLWIFTHGFSGLTGLQINLEFKSEKGYLGACWRAEPETRYFVFDDSTNWKRWKAILNEYTTYQSKEKFARGIAIWPTGLGKFSAGVNKLLDDAKSNGFHLLVLSDEDMAELYAGYALHVDVSNGNIPQANQADLLRFLGKRWQSWAERLKNAKKESSAGTIPPNTEKIDAPTFSADVLVEIISTHKMLSWSVLQTRLQERGLSPSIEAVLVATRPITDKISVLSAPNNHFFQWKS